MIYTVSRSIWDFEFWSGARTFVTHLNDRQFSILSEMLEQLSEIRNRPYSETEINDIVWFDQEMICEEYFGTHVENIYEQPVQREWSATHQTWYKLLDNDISY